ncbi:JAB domain-containing protein [Sorangium sp. So ce1078]
MAQRGEPGVPRGDRPRHYGPVRANLNSTRDPPPSWKSRIGGFAPTRRHRGDPTPTREDEAMTQELRHLSAELHVPLTAHVIVTPSGRYAAVHE